MRISGTDIYIAQDDGVKLTLKFEEPLHSEDLIVMKFSFTSETIDIPITKLTSVITFEIDRETFTQEEPGEYYYRIVKKRNPGTDIETLVPTSLFVIESTARGLGADYSIPEE